MNEAWAVLAAALGSSFLTILGTFWLERWRIARAARAATRDGLRQACVQLGSHAQGFALRAHTIYITAVFRSGIGEALDVTLYHRKPIEPMELADWLSVDLKPMLEAQSEIEVIGDVELVQVASDVVLSAMEVLGKATDMVAKSSGSGEQSQRGLGRWLRSRLGSLVPLRRDPQLEEMMRQAVRTLGQQVRRFAQVTREHIGVNDPEAVTRAFPELFSDPEVSAQGQGTSG